MGIFVQITQLLLSLGLLVLVHEFGHFLFARLFQTRVDKFYLFFNPWFSILRAKRINKRWQASWFSSDVPKEWAEHPNNTEWGLGWLPLGGYCKIAGMIDESMDKEAMKQPAKSWEFRSKPAWQRFFIITGGVLVNFVTALCIYSMMLFIWGQEYLPIKNATYGYNYCQVALDNGFMSGDKILAVNNIQPKIMAEAVSELLLGSGGTILVLRNNDTLALELPADFSKQLLANKVREFAWERVPFVIEGVMSGTPAAEAHLQKGDSIIGINGVNVPFVAELSDSLLVYAGQKIALDFIRNNELIRQEITPTENGKIGVQLRSIRDMFVIEKETYGFFAAIPAGIHTGTNMLMNYIRQFKIILTKEGAKNIGGFGAIGGLFAQVWDWARFWSMTAFLSIMFAVMNILPIPALDGGHMIFILYEMITRRKPSDKFLERAQMVGLFLLLALMIYANGNDLFRWIFGG
ncbi:MAG: RIP metalloprotease RseP [Bacteroidales bacterium]